MTPGVMRDGSTPSTSRRWSYPTTPETPLTGEDVAFDASASADDDGEIAAYAWDLDGDEFDDADAPKVTKA